MATEAVEAVAARAARAAKVGLAIAVVSQEVRAGTLVVVATATEAAAAVKVVRVARVTAAPRVGWLVACWALEAALEVVVATAGVSEGDAETGKRVSTTPAKRRSIEGSLGDTVCSVFDSLRTHAGAARMLTIQPMRVAMGCQLNEWRLYRACQPPP